MESKSVTFSYNNSKFTCGLNEIDPIVIFVEIGFCYVTMRERDRFRQSVIFNEKNPDMLVADGVEIYSDRDIIQVLNDYSTSERSRYGDLYDLLRLMSKLREDYVHIMVWGNSFIPDSPYRAGIENILLIGSLKDGPREYFRRGTLEKDGDKISFSPDEDYKYGIAGPGITLELVYELITEQNTLPVDGYRKGPGKFLIRVSETLPLHIFLRLLIACVNKYMTIPPSRAKSANS